MEHEVKDALVEALEEDGMPKGGVGNCKEYLMQLLGSYEKDVQDEGFFKRKRGRPKKGESGELSDLPTEKFSRMAMLNEKKRQARLQDRLNPGTTKEEKRFIELRAELREIGWDLEEVPGTDSDFKEKDDELKVLKKEAGDAKKVEQMAEKYDTACKAFREKKEDTAYYYSKAKECLDKKDFKRVGEFASFLKARPKELNEAYETIEKLFDELCYGLCELAEARRNENGKSAEGAFESEKQGIGMMVGEDYESYSKRMKSLGFAKSIPKTIRDTDAVVNGTEQRWRSVAGISLETFNTVKDNWQKTMQKVLRKCFIGVATKISGVNRILEMGMDFGDYDNGYGILQPMMPFSNGIGKTLGGQYGGIIVKWKPYKAVATMLFGDGLTVGRGGDNFVCPSFLTSPSPCSFAPSCKRLIRELERGELDGDIRELCKIASVPYCELQLHGGGEQYGAEAVDSLFFSSEYEVCNLSIEALSAIEDYRIGLYIENSPISIVDGKIVKENQKEAE